MKKELIAIAVIVLLFVVLLFFMNKSLNKQASNSFTDTSKVNDTSKGPPMQINQKKKYFAVLKTSSGNIEIELYNTKTPITVNSFVYLSRNKFYNNTVFHRVIKAFMIQGGDPKGDGTGGPGYRFNDEPFEGEYTRGVLAMANAGPNTNGSQFFIIHKDYSLPKDYVIFGKVIKGIETVDAIAEAPVEAKLSRPVSPVTITSIEIEEKDP